jgi:hypothetical protein
MNEEETLPEQQAAQLPTEGAPKAKRPRPANQSRRKQQISGVQIMFAAILAIGLILAINFSTRITASQPLEEIYNQTLDEIEQLKLGQATLIAERDYASSDGYVEVWARQDGKMARPGEVLVIPLPAGVSVQTTPTPLPFVEVVTAPEEPSTWELWWALFFDSNPPDF